MSTLQSSTVGSDVCRGIRCQMIMTLYVFESVLFLDLLIGLLLEIFGPVVVVLSVPSSTT